jgi:hypothetical protein
MRTKNDTLLSAQRITLAAIGWDADNILLLLITAIGLAQAQHRRQFSEAGFGLAISHYLLEIRYRK